MILERLRGGLIVSVQAEAGSVLNTPDTIALLSTCAARNGAAGVRIEGGGRIGAVRRAVEVPIIGLVKRVYDGFGPYITPTPREISEVAAGGADIVAFDATQRARPNGEDVATIVRAIHAAGRLAMADCATAGDARTAFAAGADAIGTTLCGYTPDTNGHVLPAYELVRAIANLGAFAILEGGVGEPAQVAAGFDSGAAAVVVGTAITNIDVRVRAFRDRSPRA